MPLITLTRELSDTLASACELTHLERRPIDMARARIQHKAYRQAIEKLGMQVVHVPNDENLPDGVFVEDTVVALPELVVVARVGAVSRRREAAGVRTALAKLRVRVVDMIGPGTLDGGDVLTIGNTLFVGLTSRTNQRGVDEFASFVVPVNYKVKAVEVTDCLHLKSAATLVAPDTVLLNPAWVRADAFQGYRIIEVEPSEPFAANSLTMCGTLLYSSSHPRTRRRLERAGLKPVVLDISELEKAEAGPSCMSVIVDVR